MKLPIGSPVKNPPSELSPHDARFEEIQLVAARLFAQRGYSGTDLRLIAREVGLHVSSFYNYIDSKEQLLYLVCRRGAEEHTAALERALESVRDPVERVREATRAHVLTNARLRHVAWSSLNDARMLTGPFLTDMRAREAAYEGTWRRLVAEGITAGVFRDVDIPLITAGILTMLQGVSRWFNPTGRMSEDAVADLYADLVVRGLLA